MPETSSSTGPLLAPARRSAAAPQLLIAWEPWPRAFWRNLTDPFRRRPPLLVTARPAVYWRDALVTPQMRPRHFVLSASWHVFAALLIYVLPMLLLIVPARVELVSVRVPQPIYAPLSDYLPPVNTAGEPAKVAQKGQPRYSPQEVVSLPPNPDNFEQTVISPPHPNILPQHVNLPNMVVWNPVIGPAPASATARQVSQLNLPHLDTQVVEPAPSDLGRQKLQFPALPQPSVVMPEAQNSARNIGDMNVGHLDRTVEEPVVVLPEQRAVSGTGSAQNVAPPPLNAVTGGGTDGQGVGQLIALGLNPTMPTGPIQDPGGSRHGQFAAGPKGSPDAPGTPDIAGGSNGKGGSGSGTAGAGNGNGNGLPGGIYVGAPPAGGTVGPIAGAGSPPPDGPRLGRPAGSPGIPRNTLASLARPHDIPRPTITSPSEDTGRVEDRVFGGKKYYQLTLNMPNLSSAGGSWIIRFAELHPTPAATGQLVAPAVTQKVDPAYTAQAQRNRIEGSVVLYAIIHADGTVGSVRVLKSLDDSLDHNATIALSRWKFRPASRDGVAEDVEAVVTIPFRVSKLF